MNKPNGTGLTRVINATRCSIDGLAYAYRHESAFRQELWLSVVMIPLGLFMGQDAIERVLLTMPLLLLLTVECINSAIEAAIDRISKDIHPLSKQAKDLGSAAVFFCILLVILSWSALLLPRLLS
ncbi:diacylglycerol kinase [Aestuariibacter halophilus]|uniref:Diacylglycerol kinase n=1 Tax=Fluctibacter halophilus TaxID=226011 RepID=A0ABS8G9R7_9ALTE|nr:diacylglycerol kinase [Aestuariibacter halophilus]MCC2617163.1 diacylglycerol kinase [Aestuariibacter halophilus]